MRKRKKEREREIKNWVRQRKMLREIERDENSGKEK
jgi:hypothetical protein